jgi:hypothetical protein
MILSQRVCKYPLNTFRSCLLQTQCQPHITEAAKSSVEGICKKMYNLSCDYAQKIKEKNAEILKEANISGMLGITLPTSFLLATNHLIVFFLGRFRTYLIQISRQPIIETSLESLFFSKKNTRDQCYNFENIR